MCDCGKCSCGGYLSDEDRTFVANVVQDLIRAKQMFSKYDVYTSVKDELNHLPNYFKVKKEITSVINHVIDEMWDDDIEYLKDFVTRDGKMFAVYYPAEADVEQYPEWNDTDHTDEEDTDDDPYNPPVDGEDDGDIIDDDWNDDDSQAENQFEVIELTTDDQGRIYIGKDILDKVGITGEYVAVANYGAEVAVAADEQNLEDAPNGVTYLKRAGGNAGLRVSMRNRYTDNSDPYKVSIDVDTDCNMLHIFLAE